jgi:hypothetical protein
MIETALAMAATILSVIGATIISIIVIILVIAAGMLGLAILFSTAARFFIFRVVCNFCKGLMFFIEPEKSKRNLKKKIKNMAGC